MRVLVVLGCLMSGMVGLRAEDRLAMRVSPAAAVAPAFLRVEVSVARDPTNRKLAIVAESPDFYRSSEVQVNGEAGPRVYVFEFPQLPSGVYEVRGILGDNRGDTVTAMRMVRVAPGLGER